MNTETSSTSDDDDEEKEKFLKPLPTSRLFNRLATSVHQHFKSKMKFIPEFTSSPIVDENRNCDDEIDRLYGIPVSIVNKYGIRGRIVYSRKNL
jgi:hypothetical protein